MPVTRRQSAAASKAKKARKTNAKRKSGDGAASAEDLVAAFTRADFLLVCHRLHQTRLRAQIANKVVWSIKKRRQAFKLMRDHYDSSGPDGMNVFAPSLGVTLSQFGTLSKV